MRGSEGAVALSDVPAHQRERVLSGMRWSVWLSGIAVPCGAAINLLLARVSPETIGTYGLLSVYIGLIIGFFYFGGDTVVIKFTPECSVADRASFLASYIAAVFVFISGWLILAGLYPELVALALGRQSGRRLDFILLCLAPVPILYYVVVAALKGMLEIRFSQILAKLLTIVSMAAYVVIFVTARPLLASYPAAIIWGLYIGLTGALALVGAIRIFQICGRPRLHLHFPNGFWRYAFSIQMVGVVSFFSERLDYLLVLNYAGLAVLGRYVAIMTVATVIPLMSRLVMDTLLPSLTNMIASDNSRGAGQVFIVHMRILFLVNVAGGCAVILLAGPAAEAIGPKYRSVKDLIVVMTMFQSIADPGIYGSALLSSISRQGRAVLAWILNAGVFAGLFFATWHHYGLQGAVVAHGLALVISNGALMTVALKTAPFVPSISRLWLKAAIVQTGVAAIALRWMPLGPILGLSAWMVATATFLTAAQYRISELKFLAQVFAPRGINRLFSLGVKL